MVPVAQAGVTPWYSTRLPSPCMTRPNWPLGEVIDWPAVSWAPETSTSGAPHNATPAEESMVKAPLLARTREAPGLPEVFEAHSGALELL